MRELENEGRGERGEGRGGQGEGRGRGRGRKEAERVREAMRLCTFFLGQIWPRKMAHFALLIFTCKITRVILQVERYINI